MFYFLIFDMSGSEEDLRRLLKSADRFIRSELKPDNNRLTDDKEVKDLADLLGSLNEDLDLQMDLSLTTRIVHEV